MFDDTYHTSREALVEAIRGSHKNLCKMVPISHSSTHSPQIPLILAHACLASHTLSQAGCDSKEANKRSESSIIFLLSNTRAGFPRACHFKDNQGPILALASSGSARKGAGRKSPPSAGNRVPCITGALSFHKQLVAPQSFFA